MVTEDLAAIAEAVTLDELSVENADVVFDQQDSGCVSWGVTAVGRRWFVKEATTIKAEQSLTNCLRLHQAIRHDAVVRPVRAFDARHLTLLYPWVPGTVLNSATVTGSDRSGLHRLRSLSVELVLDAISTVLDAHRQISAAGFVAIDFYDGCLLYDFSRLAVRLIDLDEYRPGPFVLEDDRLPGSRSYMAPEESRRGATIEERTTVFNLGRMIQHLLNTPAGWRGSAEQASIVSRSTDASPSRRFQTVHELANVWLGSLA